MPFKISSLVNSCGWEGGLWGASKNSLGPDVLNKCCNILLSNRSILLIWFNDLSYISKHSSTTLSGSDEYVNFLSLLTISIKNKGKLAYFFDSSISNNVLFFNAVSYSSSLKKFLTSNEFLTATLYGINDIKESL